MKKTPRAKRERKLPTVLDREEVQKLFAVIKNLKHRCILMITYSAELRISETACLKITDMVTKKELGKNHRREIKSHKDFKFILLLLLDIS